MSGYRIDSGSRINHKYNDGGGGGGGRNIVMATPNNSHNLLHMQYPKLGPAT